MTAERSVFQRAALQSVEHPFDGVYCADRRLNSVLDAEGLVVLNPEDLVQYHHLYTAVRRPRRWPIPIPTEKRSMQI